MNTTDQSITQIKSSGSKVDLSVIQEYNIEQNVKVPYIIKDKILMAPGVWNDTYYGPNEVKTAYDNTDWEDKRVRDLFWDHEDKTGQTWIGEIVNPRLSDDGEIRGDFIVLDKQAAINLEWGAKMGISPKAIGFEDYAKNMLNFKLGNFSVVIEPAIRIAYINNSLQNKEEVKQMSENVEEVKASEEVQVAEVVEYEASPESVSEEPAKEEPAKEPETMLSDKVLAAIEALSSVVAKLSVDIEKMAKVYPYPEPKVEPMKEEVVPEEEKMPEEEMKAEMPKEEVKEMSKAAPNYAENADQFKALQETIKELSSKISQIEAQADEAEMATVATTKTMSAQETVNPDLAFIEELRSMM